MRTLLSHVPKPSKAVVILSTLDFNDEVNANGKSIMNLFYNKTKGGVDTLDQLFHTYSVQRQTNRWPLATFYNLINAAGIAAHIIYQNVMGQSEQPVGKQRKWFLVNLSEQLVYQQIKARSKVSLRTKHRLSIDLVLNEA
ncbi:uncharacterized protein LOC122507645 [Leptopilina heterotoma]|uniref:uncharacterized protein LOC122507645 n=1 Tax=Leptopilina heterotoma TaxID=63436 RepID=UPI001CA7E0A2|nr:uncharacterized protein LOC122507645 [Leptopilina heterotoma]